MQKKIGYPQQALLPLFIASNLTLAAGQAAEHVSPEAASGVQQKTLTHAHNLWVRHREPWSPAKAGYDVLKPGRLCEFDALGGGANDARFGWTAIVWFWGRWRFVVYYDASKQKLTTFEWNENPRQFRRHNQNSFKTKMGTRSRFYTAVVLVVGFRVGTPGTRKNWMDELHNKYGKMPWKRPAHSGWETRKQNGFIVSPRFVRNPLEGSKERLSRFPERKPYFFNLDAHPGRCSGVKKTLKYAEQ